MIVSYMHMSSLIVTSIFSLLLSFMSDMIVGCVVVIGCLFDDDDDVFALRVVLSILGCVIVVVVLFVVVRAC